MRLFVAVKLDGEVKNTIIKSISNLKKQASSGNFTSAENLHLTLAFIGESNNITAIRNAIDISAPGSFLLSIKRSGRFKRVGGDIYWVGIENNSILAETVNHLSSELRRAGFNIEEREFTPHITIGREVTASTKIELNVPAASMTVNRISLMKSERINGKLTYTEVYGRQL